MTTLPTIAPAVKQTPTAAVLTALADVIADADAMRQPDGPGEIRIDGYTIDKARTALAAAAEDYPGAAIPFPVSYLGPDRLPTPSEPNPSWPAGLPRHADADAVLASIADAWYGRRVSGTARERRERDGFTADRLVDAYAMLSDMYESAALKLADAQSRLRTFEDLTDPDAEFRAWSAQYFDAAETA